MLVYFDIAMGMMVNVIFGLSMGAHYHHHAPITEVCMTVCMINSKQIINALYKKEGFCWYLF